MGSGGAVCGSAEAGYECMTYTITAKRFYLATTVLPVLCLVLAWKIVLAWLLANCTAFELLFLFYHINK